MAKTNWPIVRMTVKMISPALLEYNPLDMERERHLPDTNSVDQDTSAKRQYHVRQRVDWVEVGPLRIGEIIRWLLQECLKWSGVVKAEVAAHQEKAPEGEHYPTPTCVTNQNFLFRVHMFSDENRVDRFSDENFSFNKCMSFFREIWGAVAYVRISALN